MRVLVDTHVFVWWGAGDPRVSARTHSIVEDSANTVYFSAVSGWELAIKFQLGKIQLPEEPARFVMDRVGRYGMVSLPVLMSHALLAGSLPLHHRDPFDRMLVAQAQSEGLPILSADPAFAAYDVEVIW